MALTLSNVQRHSAGSQVKITGSVTFDSSYPTGGETLTAGALGLTDISQFETADTISGYTFQPTVATGGGSVALEVYEGGSEAHNHAAGGLTAAPSGETTTITYAASPGGNQCYIKFLADGSPYVAVNNATTTANATVSFSADCKLLLTHDASAASGGFALYFDDDAGSPDERLLCDLSSAVNANLYLKCSDGHVVKVTNDASASSNGTALNYDDGADQRLESANAGTSDADLGTDFGQGWLAGGLGGNVANNTAGQADEVANGTNLSTLTVPFIAWGK